MKLEDQVVSLELAKRLKELGVKQGDSYFVYDSRGILLRREGELGQHLEFWTDAFTVAELGEILPKYFGSYGFHGEWVCRNFRTKEDDSEISEERIEAYSDTEADARAKMLIHLIEKGIVKLGRSGG